jgi:hypothetical protein
MEVMENYIKTEEKRIAKRREELRKRMRILQEVYMKASVCTRKLDKDADKLLKEKEELDRIVAAVELTNMKLEKKNKKNKNL